MVNTKAPQSERRRWLAVLLGTVMMAASYLLFIWSLAALSGLETTFAGALLGIALGLVPAVFAVVSFVSQNPRALGSTMTAIVIWGLLTIPMGIVNLPTGLVAGFGGGGVVAFRLGPDHTRRSRIIAVILCVVYVASMQRFFPTAGLFAAAPLPFLAITLADIYQERRVRD